MNAQEAIERMEAELSDVELLMGDYSDESVVTYLEALSIVLESAKFLHKELINEELTQHLENTKILYLNTEYAENKAIANSKAKMIGLEGADE